MARVVLENVRVDFPIYGAQHRSLRTAIFQRATGGLIRREGKYRERVVVRALSDISMTLEEGDRVGLIGHNGSGKSTLLKVIAGIYEPIAGRLMVDGVVTPLFDMMPGLDLEDTGYENLFTAGMLLGLSREKIESKIPEIEELCELGEYLALPVRTYSSGMTMRLGFALVMALEPGVLLVDEGFGTGDLRFAERVSQRVNDFFGRSSIIVLASHSDAMIRSMCNKAALLQEGQLLAFGPVDEVFDHYRDMVHTPETKPSEGRKRDPGRPLYNEEAIRDEGLAAHRSPTSGPVRFTKANAVDESGKPRWTYKSGDTVAFRFEYEVFRPVSDLGIVFQLTLHPPEPSPGYQVRGVDQPLTRIRESLSQEPLPVGYKGVAEIVLPDLPLRPCSLGFYACLGTSEGDKWYDVIDHNVNLPDLIVESDLPNRHDRTGVVTLDYKIRTETPTF